MHFRISGDRNVERRDLLQPFDEVGGVAVAIRVRLKFRAGFRRVAAKRDNMADPAIPISARDFVDFVLARADAGQVRRGRQVGLVQDTLDGRVGPLARRSAGTIGHGDEARAQRRESLDRLPQCLAHLVGLRREEFEADPNVAARLGEQRFVPA